MEIEGVSCFHFSIHLPLLRRFDFPRVNNLYLLRLKLLLPETARAFRDTSFGL
jgi:hypothetical protein